MTRIQPADVANITYVSFNARLNLAICFDRGCRVCLRMKHVEQHLFKTHSVERNDAKRLKLELEKVQSASLSSINAFSNFRTMWINASIGGQQTLRKPLPYIPELPVVDCFQCNLCGDVFCSERTFSDHLRSDKSLNGLCKKQKGTTFGSKMIGIQRIRKVYGQTLFGGSKKKYVAVTLPAIKMGGGHVEYLALKSALPPLVVTPCCSTQNAETTTFKTTIPSESIRISRNARSLTRILGCTLFHVCFPCQSQEETERNLIPPLVSEAREIECNPVASMFNFEEQLNVAGISLELAHEFVAWRHCDALKMSLIPKTNSAPLSFGTKGTSSMQLSHELIGMDDSIFLHRCLAVYLEHAAHLIAQHPYIGMHDVQGIPLSRKIRKETEAVYLLHATSFLSFIRRYGYFVHKMHNNQHPDHAEVQEEKWTRTQRSMDCLLSLGSAQNHRSDSFITSSIITHVHVILKEMLFDSNGSACKAVVIFVASAAVCMRRVKEGAQDRTIYVFGTFSDLSEVLAGVKHLMRPFIIHAVYGKPDDPRDGYLDRWRRAREAVETRDKDTGQHYISYVLRSCANISKNRKASTIRFVQSVHTPLTAYVDNVLVSIPQLSSALRCMQSSAWSIILRFLLPDASIGDRFWVLVKSISDTIRKRDEGYWMGNDAGNQEIVNYCISVVTESLSRQECLNHCLIEPYSNAEACEGAVRTAGKFLKYISDFQQLLLTVLHISGGGPLRFTEIAALQVSNSALSSRNIFMMPGGFIGIVQGYHKTRSLRGGGSNPTLRTPDSSSAGLLVVYLLLLRPLEVYFRRVTYGKKQGQTKKACCKENEVPEYQNIRQIVRFRTTVDSDESFISKESQILKQFDPQHPTNFVHMCSLSAGMAEKRSRSHFLNDLWKRYAEVLGVSALFLSGDNQPASPAELRCWFKTTMQSFGIALGPNAYRHFHAGAVRHFFVNETDSKGFQVKKAGRVMRSLRQELYRMSTSDVLECSMSDSDTDLEEHIEISGYKFVDDDTAENITHTNSSPTRKNSRQSSRHGILSRNEQYGIPAIRLNDLSSERIELFRFASEQWHRLLALGHGSPFDLRNVVYDSCKNDVNDAWNSQTNRDRCMRRSGTSIYDEEALLYFARAQRNIHSNINLRYSCDGKSWSMGQDASGLKHVTSDIGKTSGHGISAKSLGKTAVHARRKRLHAYIGSGWENVGSNPKKLRVDFETDQNALVFLQSRLAAKIKELKRLL